MQIDGEWMRCSAICPEFELFDLSTSRVASYMKGPIYPSKTILELGAKTFPHSVISRSKERRHRVKAHEDINGPLKLPKK